MREGRQSSDSCSLFAAMVFCASCWVCFLAGMVFHWLHFTGSHPQCCCHCLPPSSSVLVEGQGDAQAW